MYHYLAGTVWYILSTRSMNDTLTFEFYPKKSEEKDNSPQVYEMSDRMNEESSFIYFAFIELESTF